MLWQIGLVLAVAGLCILFASRFSSGDNQKRDTLAAGMVVSAAGIVTVLLVMLDRAL